MQDVLLKVYGLSCQQFRFQQFVSNLTMAAGFSCSVSGLALCPDSLTLWNVQPRFHKMICSNSRFKKQLIFTNDFVTIHLRDCISVEPLLQKQITILRLAQPTRLILHTFPNPGIVFYKHTTHLKKDGDAHNPPIRQN